MAEQTEQTDTAPRCYTCGNPDTRWITYRGEQCTQCDVCDRRRDMYGTADTGAIDRLNDTATQRREDEYRDTMDAAEYGDALARAMARVTDCPRGCTCRGEMGAAEMAEIDAAERAMSLPISQTSRGYA